MRKNAKYKMHSLVSIIISSGDGVDISEMNRLLEEKKKALLAAGGDVSAIETSPQKSEQKTSIAGKRCQCMRIEC